MAGHLARAVLQQLHSNMCCSIVQAANIYAQLRGRPSQELVGSGEQVSQHILHINLGDDIRRQSDRPWRAVARNLARTVL